MPVDSRIKEIVKEAQKKHPNLFSEISAAKGPNKELGYSIFYNKGTGYNYSIIAIDQFYYLQFELTEYAENNPKKSKEATHWENHFKNFFDIAPNAKPIETCHYIDKRKQKCWRYDVSDLKNDKIIQNMQELIS